MKKVISIFGIFLIGFVIWYLFIKPYDYLVTFNAKTTAGTINQRLKLWNEGLENAIPLTQKSLNKISQQINLKDNTYNFIWSISAINDSISKVKVYASDLDNSLANKIMIPFSNTPFEEQTIKLVSGFTQKLQQHLKEIKVTIVGESETRSTYCAYITMKGLQIEKAKGMMKDYTLLTSVLSTNNVKMNGTPFVEVTNWNTENDSIYYNFCFPIIKSDSLPQHSDIQYKQYQGVKALKAIYNGNYITSDRAWYRLLVYAEHHDVEIKKTPIEVFHNNPNFGGNELRWKAEVYMPLIK